MLVRSTVSSIRGEDLCRVVGRSPDKLGPRDVFLLAKFMVIAVMTMRTLDGNLAWFLFTRPRDPSLAWSASIRLEGGFDMSLCRFCVIIHVNRQVCVIMRAN